MKTHGIMGAFLLALAGCGGGGGGDAAPVAGNPQSPGGTLPPPIRLAEYIGNWSGVCEDHELETIVVIRTPNTVDSIDVKAKTEYFSNANCSGSVLATETETGVYTIRYLATVNASVVLAPGSNAVPATIEQITASSTASTVSIVGPAVVRNVSNGQAQWCIDYGSGRTVCIHDTGTQPAQSGASGALTLSGGDMYLLSASGSIYVADQKFRKK